MDEITKSNIEYWANEINKLYLKRNLLINELEKIDKKLDEYESELTQNIIDGLLEEKKLEKNNNFTEEVKPAEQNFYPLNTNLEKIIKLPKF